ncbi:MAG: hypothetical protein GX995_05090, partial [Clostridiales bacterium]|nr:hypothetical protein [Clostridiales bacterium]
NASITTKGHVQLSTSTSSTSTTTASTPSAVKTVNDALIAHKAEIATQDKAGHIKLSDIPLPAIATQSEAEAGTNNTKMMTPLRTNQAIDSKVRVVDNNLLELNIDGAMHLYLIKPTFLDNTSAPGSKYAVAGDWNAGFFGEVPASELITGDALASLVGISAGTSQFSNEPWLKFAYEGKIQFVAKKPFRYGLPWNNINSANAVYGGRTVNIGGLTYKIRLMRTGTVDPMPSYKGTHLHGSEWNRLMLPIHIGAKDRSWAYPSNVESSVPYWGIDYTDADLLTHNTYGDGSRSWCQETYSSSRVSRGDYGASSSTTNAPSGTGSSSGWRPVLELVA